MDDFYIDIDLTWLLPGNLFSDPTVEKAKVFRKELEVIDKRLRVTNPELDSIFNHCKTYIGYVPVKFFFTDNVVPEEIQRECLNTFKRIFG